MLNLGTQWKLLSLKSLFTAKENIDHRYWFYCGAHNLWSSAQRYFFWTWTLLWTPVFTHLDFQKKQSGTLSPKLTVFTRKAMYLTWHMASSIDWRESVTKMMILEEIFPKQEAVGKVFLHPHHSVQQHDLWLIGISLRRAQIL